MTDQPLVKINTDNAAITASQSGGDLTEFAKVTQSGTYLPRLQLMSSNSDKCKAGDFPINHYALVRDQTFIDLGVDVDILIIAWRPKALDIGGEELVTSFDQASATFKDIQERSQAPNSGCMYGPEFLVYIPAQEAYATFFMGSKSSRREAPNVIAKLQGSGTLTSKLVETKRFKWQTPIIKGCSTPFDIPEAEDVQEQVDKFLNPKSSELEVAEDTGGEQRAR